MNIVDSVISLVQRVGSAVEPSYNLLALDEANALVAEVLQLRAEVLQLRANAEQVEHKLKAAREDAAKLAEAWADGQDRVAVLRETDGVLCSAETHSTEAMMARRIAAAIRRGDTP